MATSAATSRVLRVALAVLVVAGVSASVAWILAEPPASTGPAVLPAPTDLLGRDEVPTLAEAAAPARSALPVEEPAITAAPAPAVPGEHPESVVVHVRDWRREPLPGAHVLVAAHELPSVGSLAECRDDGSDRPFVFDGLTGADGCARFGYGLQGLHHIRVEGPDGVPATTGQTAFFVSGVNAVRLEYTIGRLFGAAFVLADGSEAVSRQASFRQGSGPLPPRVLMRALADLGARLAVPPDHVFVDVTLERERDAFDGVVSVYHAHVGWFDAPIRWTPIAHVEPTLVRLPQRDVVPPVCVTIACSDAMGRPLEIADIRLTGGAEAHRDPPVSYRLTSGRPTLVRPGRYRIALPKAQLNAACDGPREVTIEHDTVLRLPQRWNVVTSMLLLSRGGRPYRGPALFVVETEGGEGSYRVRSSGTPEGRFPLDLRADRQHLVTVTVRGETRELRYTPGFVPAECGVAF